MSAETLQGLWGWALGIDEGYAYRLYCAWDDGDLLSFAALLINGIGLSTESIE